MSKKVVVAMSGGVDSSVTAALLKERGFEVIGVTMKVQDNSSAISSAKKVADRLGILHRVIDLEKIFKDTVITYFCKEYSEGRTPNPCIKCNKYIKFGALLDGAKEMGARFIATGHYARVEYDEERKRYIIKKGIDSRKDQSYMLYTLTQEQLKHILMPLGEFTKEQTREKARALSLPAADREESQEICFIPDNNYVEFLRNYIPETFKPGPILNKEGKILGEHKGILSYTIGQREGLGIAYKEPLYVIGIDKRENTITVGTREDTYHDEVYAKDVNYIGIEGLVEPSKVKAKIRYLHSESEAVLESLNGNGIRLKFREPQFAVTPGQSVVFYEGDTVIGGGIIHERFS